MNVTVLLIVAVVLFFLAYRFYTRFIAKLFNENDNQPTPACALRDDCDYAPTKPVILFGNHFASIAEDGPIIGPTVALLFGYLPVWLWAVIGWLVYKRGVSVNLADLRFRQSTFGIPGAARLFVHGRSGLAVRGFDERKDPLADGTNIFNRIKRQRIAAADNF